MPFLGSLARKSIALICLLGGDTRTRIMTYIAVSRKRLGLLLLLYLYSFQSTLSPALKMSPSVQSYQLLAILGWDKR